jgi:hypothetical protein
MAFNNWGALTALAPGAQVTWWYTWGTTNMGTQFASADVKTANGTPCLAFDQTKCINPDGTVVYNVTIRNIGSQYVWHNLQGGGMS